MFRSPLLWKLFGAYLVLIVAAALVVGSTIRARARDNALEQHRETLLFSAELMRDVALPALRGPAGGPLERSLEERVAAVSDRDRQRLTVMRADGVVIADSTGPAARLDNHLQRPEVQAAIAEGLGSATRFSRTQGRRIFYVALPVRSADELLGVVRAAVSVSELEAQVEELNRVVLWGALLAAGFGLIAALLFAQRFSRSVDDMAVAAESIAAGDYDAGRSYANSRELGRLASALNAMATKLRDRVGAIESDRAKLLAILGSMAEGVIAVDAEDKVVHMNEVAGRFLGVAPAAAEGRRIWEAVRISEISELLDTTREVKRDVDGEVHLSADGSGSTQSRSLELRASPLRSGGNEVTGAVLVLNDVTELRHLEGVRRDFVANVSHELKTPLTAIRGLVETLQSDPQAPEGTRQRFLGRVLVQTARLTSLVSDLLTLARVESREASYEPRSIDLCASVRECAGRFAQRARTQGVELTLALSEAPVVVQADEEALRQIIDNLTDNAVKYTPEGGRVELAVERVSQEGRERARLSVRDTGIGLEPAEKERVFERFYRVDKARSRELGGTGLGLSIVKHQVLSLGGRIRVESTPGQGSVFQVDLPTSAA